MSLYPLYQGYKEREVAFRTGGLGRHMQEDVYESWVCMDHFCGDPVFCWVYHETEKVFTPWGTNSELLLITVPGQTSFRTGADDAAVTTSGDAASVVEGGAPWGVKEWLVSIFLQGYTDAMIEYGYDSLIALDAGSEQEIKDMTEDEAVVMKKPHRALFMREWRNRSWVRTKQLRSP